MKLLTKKLLTSTLSLLMAIGSASPTYIVAEEGAYENDPAGETEEAEYIAEEQSELEESSGEEQEEGYSSDFEVVDTDESEPEQTILTVDSAAEFAGAMSQFTGDPDDRLIITGDSYFAGSIADLEYAAVSYDEITVVEFASKGDKDAAVSALSDEIGGDKVAEEVVFHVDTDDEIPAAENQPEIVSGAETALPASGLRARADAEGKKVIAIIDTGVDGGLADESVDLTGTGVNDSTGHGTQMANIIRTLAGDNVLILSIKAFGNGGTSTSSLMTAAVLYAIESGVDYINISASANDSQDAAAFKEAVGKAIAAGIVVAGSAGNGNGDAANRIPANIDGVIGVTSVEVTPEEVRITGKQGLYVDYGVVAGSTSEATAAFTAYHASGTLDAQMNKFVYAIDTEGVVRPDPTDEESQWREDCNDFFYGDAYYWAVPLGETNTNNATLIPGYQQETFTDVEQKKNGYEVINRACNYDDDYERGNGKWDHDDKVAFTTGHGYATFTTTHRFCSTSRYMGKDSDGDKYYWNGYKYSITRKTIPSYKYLGYNLIQQQGGGNTPIAIPAHVNVNLSQLKTGTTVKVELGEGGMVTNGDKDLAQDAPASPDRSPARKSGFRLNFYYQLDQVPLTIMYLEKGTEKVLAEQYGPKMTTPGTTYNVVSPTVENYRLVTNADAIKTGTMPTSALVLKVYYEPMPPAISDPYKRVYGGTTVIEGLENSVDYTDMSYRYDIYQVIPEEEERTYFSMFMMRDALPANILVESVAVYADETDVSEYFDFRTTTDDQDPDNVQNTLMFTATPEYLATAAAYGKTYDFRLNVKVAPTVQKPSEFINDAVFTIRYADSELEQNYPYGNTDTVSDGDPNTRTTNTVKTTFVPKIPVRKVWEDEDGYYDERPSSITIHFVGSDGSTINKTLTAADDWNAEFTDIPGYTVGGEKITYTMYEDEIDMYDASNTSANPLAVTFNSMNVITNRYIPDYPVQKKVFDDDENDIDGEIVLNGDTLHYIVYVTNPAQTAKRFDVEDMIPENSTYIADSANLGGVYDASAKKITWSGVEIPAGETKEFKFNVTAVGSDDTWVRIANVATSWMLRPSGTRNPNTEKLTNEVVNEVPPIMPASGDIKHVYDKYGDDIDGMYVEKDDNLYYEITVKNGSTKARDYTITDVVPANTEFVEAKDGGTYSEGVVTWNKTIPAGQSIIVRFTVKATQEASDIINKAQISVDHVQWYTNEVENRTAVILIDKTILHSHASYGQQVFLYQIDGSDDSVNYRYIETDGTGHGSAKFNVPRYTPIETTYDVHELRNARYVYESVSTSTPDTTTVNTATGYAHAVFDQGKTTSSVSYINDIENWMKASHAAAVINRVRKGE